MRFRDSGAEGSRVRACRNQPIFSRFERDLYVSLYTPKPEA